MRSLKKTTLLLLLGGRFSYRGMNILSNLFLLAIWGPQVFGSYASLVGTWLFLTPLVGWGLEKSALKLLPRTTIARPHLLTALLGLSAMLTLPFATGFLLCLLLDSSATPVLSSTLGLLSVMLGTNQVLVGYNRALGKPALDFVNYFGLALFNLLGVTLTFFYSLSPITYSVYLLVGVVSLNLVLAISLKAHTQFLFVSFPKRRLVKYSLNTAFFMGFNNIVTAASISVLFFVLSQCKLETQSSYLYIGISAFNLAFAFGEYILRIYQPKLALFLKQQHIENVQKSIARQLRIVIRLAPLYLVLLFLIERSLDSFLRSLTWPIPGYGLTVCFLFMSAPIFLTTEIVCYILENLDAKSLIMTSSGALIAFLSTAGLSFFSIPAFGSPGAILALASGEIAHSITVFFLLKKAGSHLQ